jgi:phosphatidate phosphatase PAH1
MSLSNFVSNFNRIYGPFKEWYSKINPANMTGAIDVIVVQQQVISLFCHRSPISPMAG